MKKGNWIGVFLIALVFLLSLTLVVAEDSCQFCTRYADGNKIDSAGWTCADFDGTAVRTSFTGWVGWNDDIDYKIEGCEGTEIVNSCEFCTRYSDNNGIDSAKWKCTDFDGTSVRNSFEGGVDNNDDIEYKVDCEGLDIGSNYQFCTRYADVDQISSAEWVCGNFDGTILRTSFEGGVDSNDDIEYKITKEETCEGYCDGQLRPACIGYWDISGTYPDDCVCSWNCDIGPAPVPEPEIECEDSDGGENYYVKGTLETSLGVVRKDYCWNDDSLGKEYSNFLREYSCQLNQNPLDSNIEGFGGPEDTGYYEINYDCPNGCDDDACLSESNETETCTDSDGGKNYYVKGYLNNHVGVNFEDYCLNSNDLLERHCSEDPNEFSESYSCTNGCLEGVCKCDTLDTLSSGESKTYTSPAGKSYEVGVVVIDSKSVEFEINGERTDRFGKGSYRVGGVSITLEDINYESFAGGVQEAEFCLYYTDEPEDCTDLIENPRDLLIDEFLWELKYNDSSSYGGGKNYYRNFVNDYDDGYYSVSVNINEVSESEGRSIEERLGWTLDYNICEQEVLYLDDNKNKEQVVYICRDLWGLAHDSQSIEKDADKQVTVLWISGNRLFELRSYSYDYWGGYCNSYEDCMRREEEMHREQQRDIVEVLEKLIDNNAEYVGGFHLNWKIRNFVQYFLDYCGSDIEKEEGYIGSWTCKLEPVICPPHGEQTEVCTRYNENLGENEMRESVAQCSPGICSGCMVPRWFGDIGRDNKCIPYGFRFEHQTSWGIEEVFVDDYDSDGLTVAQANDYNEVDLEVYEGNTALLIFETESGNFVNISLEIGETYDWNFEGNDGLDQTIFVDNIFYDSVNYEDSYIEITFHASGIYQRKVAETLNAYCNYDGRIMGQKIGVARCQNSYECESNLCSGGECVEIGEILNELSGFRKFTVNILCTLADWFRVETYEQCVAGNVDGSSGGGSGGGSSGGSGKVPKVPVVAP